MKAMQSICICKLSSMTWLGLLELTLPSSPLLHSHQLQGNFSYEPQFITTFLPVIDSLLCARQENYRCSPGLRELLMVRSREGWGGIPTISPCPFLIYYLRDVMPPLPFDLLNAVLLFFCDDYLSWITAISSFCLLTPLYETSWE